MFGIRPLLIVSLLGAFPLSAFAAAGGPPRPGDDDTQCAVAADLLCSAKRIEANRGYRQAFLVGESCLGDLIALTSDLGTFRGVVPTDEASCDSVRSDVTVADAALYLFDAILYEDAAPYYSTRLVGAEDLPEGMASRIAIDAYRNWWRAYGGLPMKELRRLPHPLAGTGLSWNGPALGVTLVATGSGTEEPGTKTPSKFDCVSMPDGPDPGTDPDPYAWMDTPSTPGGPKPYNCLAWAVNCYTDRWVDTSKGTGDQWKQILKDHGYDPDKPVDCSGKCPDGKGPKTKMIWNLGTGETAKDSNWVHAMKQEDDGDWSSKNGQGSRWKDITDCTKFLDKHYPTPSGKTREVKCYCKK